MVKKSTNIANLTKFLTKSLLSQESPDLALNLNEFLDLLVESELCIQAVILNNDHSRQFFSNSTDLEKCDLKKFEVFKIDDWGFLYLKNKTILENDFWDNLVDQLTLFINCVEQKLESNLVANATSEIRRTLKPEIALEKIYSSFREFARIEDFYFFKKLVNTEDDLDDELFKGYQLFYPDQTKSPKDLQQIIQFDEILNFDFVNPNFYPEIFKSKVRGREWGVMVVSRRTPWTNHLKKIFELFSEQIATVFNQHELHSESLNMAQKEFLLNQITTKIRESLSVDQIIDTTVQEVAQVMGAESCSVIILNRKIRGTLGHRVWSVDSKLDSAMVEALYSSLNSDIEPNWLDPSVAIADTDLKSEDEIIKLKNLGIKSFLSAGMFREQNKELVGVIAVGFFNQLRNWSHDEQQLLEGVSKQLEIALTQAAIYQEAQQTRRQMALLHRLSSDIRDSLDVSKVLGQIAKGIGEVLGLNRCFVRRFSDEQKILKTEEEFCSSGYQATADLIFNFEKEWITNLAESKAYNKSMEILNIPSVTEKLKNESPYVLKIAQAIGLKSYLSIPLVARGKVLGTITVHQCDRERNFLPEEIEFILRVGSEAAIALEHAALFDTINKFNKIDPDTGLYNKKYFREIAEQEIKRCKLEGKGISYMLIDVDNLKTINDDTHNGGHLAGDEAIQILSTVLANTVRQTPIDDLNHRVADIVGRFGGDEFMVLLPNTNIHEALRAADRIAQNLAKAKHSTWPTPLTCSIGVAGTPHDPYDYEKLKTRADLALYLSKGKGRNAISSTLEI
jgi:diguanylate cyclase (GGDEF)-like protein